MHLTDKNVWIVPTEDARVQLIIVPLEKNTEDQKSSLSDQVKALMKDIDESKIVKKQSLCLPSFKIEKQQVSLGDQKFKLSEEEHLTPCQMSFSIDLIHGRPTQAPLKQEPKS